MNYPLAADEQQRLESLHRSCLLDTPAEERFDAVLKLAEVPRNASKTRVRNRCLVSGRPRGFYRKLKMSRVALRQLGSEGLIPGLVKSSW